MIYLLIDSHGIESLVHDINPPIFGRKHEERHESLAQIIEIVLVVHPSVAVGRQLQALGFVGHVLGIRPLAIVENALEQLITRENDKIRFSFYFARGKNYLHA